MSKTINDFRNFYRPDNEKQTFNVCNAMDNVFEILNIDQNKIEIELNYEHRDNANIHTFEGELKQVFMSIINNALDALKENSITKPKILIYIKDIEESVLISICDNAGGIPTDIVENIFLPYFSTKAEKNGTGLGLYMSKTIIEEHVKGSLTVENSKLHNGAEFFITIPKTTI